MLAIIIVSFLVIQALVILLMIGSCIVAAVTDRQAVRPYVPQNYEFRSNEPRSSGDFGATRIHQSV
ncbi:MAG TPA: hypothetical protein VE268_06145 [Herpetosiphonaceae bacterium]|jgi:hypothetical protein|nr:hypothetical protein [Herpetosiphonaceae bacterium]